MRPMEASAARRDGRNGTTRRCRVVRIETPDRPSRPSATERCRAFPPSAAPVQRAKRRPLAQRMAECGQRSVAMVETAYPDFDPDYRHLRVVPLRPSRLAALRSMGRIDGNVEMEVVTFGGGLLRTPAIRTDHLTRPTRSSNWKRWKLQSRPPGKTCGRRSTSSNVCRISSRGRGITASNGKGDAMTEQATKESPYIAPGELAGRWQCSRSSVDRIARRAGLTRLCLGEGRNGMGALRAKGVEAYEAQRRVQVQA